MTQVGGQGTNRRVPEQIDDREILMIERHTELAVHLGEQDGVPAQLEKIIGCTHLLGLECLGPDRRDGLLQVGLRRGTLCRRNEVASPHRPQGEAIDFSGWRSRHLREHDPIAVTEHAKVIVKLDLPADGRGRQGRCWSYRHISPVPAHPPSRDGAEYGDCYRLDP